MKRKRILVVVPSFSLVGGVANHYMGLEPYWTEDVRYCVYGKRERMPAVLCMIPDLLVFMYKLAVMRPDIVVVNPSLRPYQLVRDAVYLLIAKLFRKSVVTFFHGWDLSLAARIEKRPALFRWVYGRSSLIYVLCSDFAASLERMGIVGRVKLNTTKVADHLVEGFDMAARNRPATHLLYLARIDKYKGIYVAIDAFELLQKEFPELKFTIVGNGVDEQRARKYVAQKNLTNVNFTGGLHGKDLAAQFAQGDIYVLPSYFEGMATSVLEAMAFGLPVVTAPVGGVKDFFEGGKMGFLIDSYAAKDYADCIGRLVKDDALRQTMSQTNYQYAHEHFMASAIARRMEHDFSELV